MMNNIIQTSVSFFVMASGFIMSAGEVRAQSNMSGGAHTWPIRPVRLIVPFAPGGATDVTARAIAKEVANVLGQSIVIDNRGGANAIIGSDLLAKSAPDGYTMMQTSIAFATNTVAYKKLPFDTSRDFTPITNPIVGQGALLVVNASVPAKSVAELITLAKTQKLAYGSPGVGNVLHLMGAAFAARAGIQMLHVPYSGSGPALTALLGGEVQVLVAPTVASGPHIKSGRLRPLGYTGAKRLPIIADVPTIAEAGLPGFAMDAGWHGWFGPAGMPAPVVEKVYSAIRKSLELPALRDYLIAGGYEVKADPPAVFQKNFPGDLKRWGDVVRLAGLEPQ